MKKTSKTLDFTFERTIPARAEEVYDAWLDRKVPGTPWNFADKVILNPEVDGFFYLAVKDCPHYGRFQEVKRPGRLKHTWVSPNTLGQESTVIVTFKKQGDATLLTLRHSDLPDTEDGRRHEQGWEYFLNLFPQHFAELSGKTS